MAILSMRVKQYNPPRPVVNKMEVLVTGDLSSYEELGSIAVRQEVIQFARAHGLSSASGLGNIGSSPYPVNKDGECTEELMAAKEPPFGFEVEYTVNASIR